MRLTDSTQVRSICQGKLLAVYEPGKPALLIDVAKHSDNVFECGDLYHGAPAFTLDPDYEGGWYPDSPEDLIQSCTALRVGFENGSICVAGHRHFTDAEYYTEEEAHHNLEAGHPLAPNARII